MDRVRFAALSDTQLAVLWLKADHARGAIAQKLGMRSVETVKTHLATIRARLPGVDLDEASRALRQLIPPPPPWVSPPWGIEAPPPAVALPPQPDAPCAGPDGVLEPAVPMDFTGWGETLPDRDGARRDDPSELTRSLTLIGGRALKIAVYLLCMLAVAEALQRWVWANPHFFPF